MPITRPDEITAQAIVEIHEMLIDWFADSADPVSPPGVKDLKLVESAVARPFQSAGGIPAYKGIHAQSAALFHSLLNNHAFHNGNKRIALVSAQVLLNTEGWWIDRVSDGDLFEFTRAAAAHEIVAERKDEHDFITGWFEQNTTRVTRGEHPMKYGALKESLERFGYTIDPPEGMFLNIYKDGVKVTDVIKQGIKGFRPYHTDYIWRLRKKLGLTPEEGVDSRRFYGDAGIYDVASEFIELRIEVMKQLAKT